MSLSFWLSNPAQSVNLLALFFAVAGSWVLIATQLRGALWRPVAAVEGAEPRRARLDRFFNRFGGACLGVALVVSWESTRL
ncbi:hypothetical protein [Pseudomonas sp.]|jgi:hypothetical protein|uniref:hypothetical protein n=1 Tax=Pseudomonas sp. TaxID=306 RepID=UPI0028B190A4|nr:hypothetical protein [Pseudomonas sp.]